MGQRERPSARASAAAAAAGGRGQRRGGLRSGAGSRPWQVWVDTGGTFTDCLALPPSGPLRRAKVLSSGCLRARVVAANERSVALAGLAPLAVGPLPGWRLRALAGGEEVTVVALEAGGVVRLAARLPPELSPGATCELVSPEEAPVLACRLVTGTPAGAALPPLALRLATTLGTNALLERRGAATALFVTAGFADLLAIGTQQRPDLFALDVRRPPPLPAKVIEVEERLAADGSLVRPLDLAAVRPGAEAALRAGIRSAAVALLHSYRRPDHERELAAALRQWGFAHVSASAALAPSIGYLARTETAVVDAYLAPLLGAYLDHVAGALATGEGEAGRVEVGRVEVGHLGGGRRLLVMTSAGGLVAASSFQPREGLLSGPAGGVVGAVAAAARSRLARVLCFDMGGTSTDVARCDGEVPWVHEHQVGGARLLAPAVAVETVAAGGGSLCRFDGHRLLVGPASAGARPGPACYGAGGPLCLTDVNLLLGRLHPERFEIPLRPAAAEEACARLEAVLGAAGLVTPREELLAGLLRIADERMAEAIREISVRQGYDPRDYALLAFGGAGGQHACAVAELLGMATVLLPPDAGLLSALGLGAARLERVVSRQVLRPLPAVEERLAGWIAELAREASAAVVAQGVVRDEVRVERAVAELRWSGQDATVEVPLVVAGRGKGKGAGRAGARQGVAPAVGDLAARFAARYRELYGYLPAARDPELVALRVAAAGPGGLPARVLAAPRSPDRAARAGEAGGSAPTPLRRRAWFGRWRSVPVHERGALAVGATLRGPALVVEAHTTSVVAAGWDLEVDAAGALLLRRRSRSRGRAGGGSHR